MKKRVLSMFLCLCMTFTLVGAMVPTAWAITDADRREIDAFIEKHGAYITANNPYYGSEKGTQKLTEKTYPDGSPKRVWRCTAYVWQRVYNEYSVKLPDSRWGRGYAEDWLSGAEAAGFETGDTPKPNSIVVYSGDTYGHVALVTAVNGNTMIVDEAGRTLDKYQKTGGIALNETRTTAKTPLLWGVYKLEGYIYLDTPAQVDPPPAMPQNLTGKWTSRGPKWQAKISWNPVSGATGYEVQYRTPAMGGNEWKTDGDYKTGISYTSTGLGNHNYYEYRVRAYNSGGKSGWVDYTLEKYPVEPTEPTPPAKPENLSVGWTIYRGMNPRISWSAASGAEYYEVMYKKANESFWCSTAPVKSGTSCTFPELSVEASWDFRVKAVNAAGSSDWAERSLSAPQNIIADLIKKDPAIVPTAAAPTGVSGRWTSTGSNAAAELTWNTVSGVDYYEVGYKKDGDSWVTIPSCITSTNTSYVFHNLDSSSSYSFRIKAVKSGVSSAWTECTLDKSGVEELAAPTGISGTWTSTGPKWQARISWNPVSGATRYEVQYKTPKTGNAWKTDGDYRSGTSYISTGLGDYNSYDYRVRACNSAGFSDWTTYTLVKTTTVALAAPTGVSGTWTSSSYEWEAKISWNAVSGATRYEVQYRTPKTGNEWRADPDYASGTSYISTGLGNYNSYDYRVRAVNAAGVSDWTEYTLVKPTSTQESTTPPAAPTNISGEWTSTGPKWQARISWSPVSSATRYEVQYRTPSTGNAWRADADYSSGTSYISTGLGNYNSYDYRVRAVNANGASSWTEYTLVKPGSTPEPTPAAPTNVSGTWTSRGPKWQARISWNAVSGATRYEVQYRTPKTNNEWRTDADYSSGTSYISTGLGNYNSYDYRVRAVNATGASEWAEYTLYK